MSSSQSITVEVIAQQRVESLRALLGEENPRSSQFNGRLRPRNTPREPMGPGHRKVNIIGSPHDKSGSLQGAQLRFDGERVLVIESSDEPLQVPCPLCAADMRSQVDFDVLVRDIFQMFIGRTKRAR